MEILLFKFTIYPKPFFGKLIKKSVCWFSMELWVNMVTLYYLGWQK